MLTKQRLLLLAVLLIALIIWFSRQQGLGTIRQELDQSQHYFSTLTNKLESVSRKLVSLQQEQQQQRISSLEIKKELTAAERELAAQSPDSQWAAPPNVLPEWNSASPYIWVQKDTMKQLHERPFTKEGALPMESTIVFAIEPHRLKELNQRLSSILAEYRKVESETVHYTDQHLIPIRNGHDALTITWNPPKEEGVRFRSEFEATLRQQLGDQRTEILLALDSGRLDEDFGQVSEEEKLGITLERTADGIFNVAVQRGSSWLQTSVSREYPQSLERNIPVHFYRFFSSLLESP